MNSESRAVERYLLLRNFILTSVRKNLSIMKQNSAEAAEVEKLLEEAFPQDAQLFVWLTTNHRLLNGQMPSALILCFPHNPEGVLTALQEDIAAGIL